MHIFLPSFGIFLQCQTSCSSPNLVRKCYILCSVPVSCPRPPGGQVLEVKTFFRPLSPIIITTRRFLLATWPRLPLPSAPLLTDPRCSRHRAALIAVSKRVFPLRLVLRTVACVRCSPAAASRCYAAAGGESQYSLPSLVQPSGLLLWYHELCSASAFPLHEDRTVLGPDASAQPQSRIPSLSSLPLLACSSALVDAGREGDEPRSRRCLRELKLEYSVPPSHPPHNPLQDLSCLSTLD
jgi:hypothetical protein